jgi:hypothetical protein
MKVQALDIRIGDRIIAYCNNRQQTCTVKQVIESGQDSITLKVSPSDHYRSSLSRIVSFRRDALVDLAG